MLYMNLEPGGDFMSSEGAKSVSDFPAWSRDYLFNEFDLPNHSRACLATGWPFRSFMAEFSQYPMGQPFLIKYGKMIRPPKPLPLDAIPYVIPLRPIWKGFLSDTIFFFLVLDLMGFFTAKVRFFTRPRCSRCPECG